MNFYPTLRGILMCWDLNALATMSVPIKTASPERKFCFENIRVFKERIFCLSGRSAMCRNIKEAISFIVNYVQTEM